MTRPPEDQDLLDRIAQLEAQLAGTTSAQPTPEEAHEQAERFRAAVRAAAPSAKGLSLALVNLLDPEALAYAQSLSEPLSARSARLAAALLSAAREASPAFFYGPEGAGTSLTLEQAGLAYIAAAANPEPPPPSGPPPKPPSPFSGAAYANRKAAR